VIPPSRQRNALQSGLYLIIAGILAVVLLERLLTYAEALEKANMEVTLSRLHSGLYARLAYLALRGENEAFKAASEGSPFQALNWHPPEYIGEYAGVPRDAERGKWLYDEVRKELVYVPNLKRHLAADPSDPEVAHLRFRLEVRKSAGVYTGVAFRPVTAFRWDPTE
jgi:hypothetical protein